MACMFYSARRSGRSLEEQDRLVKLGPADEIVEPVQCGSARVEHPRHERGLRHRFKPETLKTTNSSISRMSEDCEHLLGDQIAKSFQGSSKKVHHSFSQSIEKYLSACRFNVRFKPWRPAKPKKLARPSRQMQTNLEGDHSSGSLSCFGQGWKGLRKRLADIITIEEEIFPSVPRSVLYFV